MTDSPQNIAMQSLEPLIGESRMDTVFPSSSPAAGMEADGVARAVFEYLPGWQFVIQRWEVPHPDAPDGIAIIGWIEPEAACFSITSIREAWHGCMR